MTKRKRHGYRAVVGILLEQGAKIPCKLCGEPIEGEHVNAVILEHMERLSLNGNDDLENLAFVHGHCADKKTNGTKATTRGSDSQEAARDRRLSGERPKRRGARIPSRGFQKPPEGYKHQWGRG